MNGSCETLTPSAAGFDFIPDGSTYTTKREGIQESELKFVMQYCKSHVPAKQVLGFVICPWVTTTPGLPQEKFVKSMDFAREQFERFGR